MMFQIVLNESIPAVTRGVNNILTEGEFFTPRKDATTGAGHSYWVDLDPVEIPKGHVGLVTYGNPGKVGTIKIVQNSGY